MIVKTRGSQMGSPAAAELRRISPIISLAPCWVLKSNQAIFRTSNYTLLSCYHPLSPRFSQGHSPSPSSYWGVQIRSAPPRHGFPTCLLLSFLPGRAAATVLGSDAINLVLTRHLVQWLNWIFVAQLTLKKRKERRGAPKVLCAHQKMAIDPRIKE